MGIKRLIMPWPHWRTLRVGEIAMSMSVALVVGLSLGMTAMAVDTIWLWPPPVRLGTVEGARVLLGSLTAGMITVAVFGLWMRTVVVGLMAAHFSPRTLLVFLDDRFQRRLLAVMSAGAVAVMAMLLRLPAEDLAPAPLVSTLMAILIALSGLACMLLAIQHATRSLSLPELISRLADDAFGVFNRLPEARIELTDIPPSVHPQHRVFGAGVGWVTGIDVDRMLKALPAGGVIHLRCRIGQFVTSRRPVAIVSSIAASEVDFDTIADAVKLARTRSPDMDLAFSVSQLVDVGTFALQARSDTSTAHEVLVHLEDVLEEVVDRGLPRLHDKDDEGRCVYDEAGWDAVDLVQLCAERLRDAVCQDPEAARHLMCMLHRVKEVAQQRQVETVISEVTHQIEMVQALVDSNAMLTRDRQRLEQLRQR